MEEEKKEIFELKKWNAVAVWSWNTDIENCAICKMYLSDNCPLCIGNTSAQCQPVWGECNHPFHNHCITRWLESKNTCPLCSRPWASSRFGN